MFQGDKNVVTCNAIVLWDGITRPETNDSGRLVHSIKVAIAPGSPELAELEKIAKDALLANPAFNGVLPDNGNWPLIPIEVGKIDPSVDGHIGMNAKTYNGAPEVYDANGLKVSNIVYGNQLYAGAVVRLMVHAYSFNNKSKGVAFGVDGIQIIDATAPKLAIASGVDAGAAFKAANAPVAPIAQAPYTQAPAPVAPPVAQTPAAVAPAPDFLTPTPPTPPVAPPPAPPVSGPAMTAKAAGQPYEAFIAQGWTDETLRAGGYIV